MEESISIDNNAENDSEYVKITISTLSALHCNKKRLIESSDYFEAIIQNGGFKEGALNCVNFTISE